jgi:hypothetical protein
MSYVTRIFTRSYLPVVAVNEFLEALEQCLSVHGGKERERAGFATLRTVSRANTTRGPAVHQFSAAARGVGVAEGWQDEFQSFKHELNSFQSFKNKFNNN